MKSEVKQAIWKLYQKIKPYGNKSYSQQGEDLIVDFVLTYVFMKREVSYIDIGANDPIWLNNTYLFYNKSKRNKGVLIEPNPEMGGRLHRKRRRDTILNCGVGTDKREKLTYYMMDANTLNGFSEEEAKDYEKKGHTIVGTKDVDVIPINDILKKYGDGKFDFMSIDVEGLDFDIIKAINYEKYSPLIMCVETSEYEGVGRREDYDEMKSFLSEKGYMVYAESGINTIFILKDDIEKAFERLNKMLKDKK